MKNIQWLNVAVGTAPTVLGSSSLIGNGDSKVNIEVENLGSVDLSVFKLQLKNLDGNWYDFLSDTDWGTPSYAMQWSSTNQMYSCPAGQSAQAHVNVNAAYAIRAVAAVGSGTTNVNVRITSKDT